MQRFLGLYHWANCRQTGSHIAPFQGLVCFVVVYLGRCPIGVNLVIIIFLSIEPSACTIPG